MILVLRNDEHHCQDDQDSDVHFKEDLLKMKIDGIEVEKGDVAILADILFWCSSCNENWIDHTWMLEKDKNKTFNCPLCKKKTAKFDAFLEKNQNGVFKISVPQENLPNL